VNLIGPYDEGVLYAAQTKGEAILTSPVQTYLDLRQIKGRGEQAADFLMQQVIQPTWSENEKTTPLPPLMPPNRCSSS
jgi:hypothetical protein